MPTVTRNVNVPANGEVDILAGTEHEFPGPRGNSITVAATTDVAAEIELDVTFGSKRIVTAASLRAAGANGVPLLPDDVKVRDFAMPGEKIRAVLRNTTGLAARGAALVDIS